MNLHSRLRTLERLAAVPDRADLAAEWHDTFRRDLDAFLPHVPEEYRNAVAEAATTDTTEQFSEWMMSPEEAGITPPPTSSSLPPTSLRLSSTTWDSANPNS